MRSDRDPIDASAVRNLDEIQEDDPGVRPSRAGALVLASLGGACIVFAAALLMRSPPKAKVVSHDPLGDLVAQARPGGSASAAPAATVGGEVTFPGVLSDAKHPTTALEAVRDAKGEFTRPASTTLPFDLPPGAPTTPPPATDRLPVVPLPAQNVLQGPPAEAPATDTLGTMARNAARETGQEAAAGGPGAYQLQVSSFKTQTEAEAFAAALRRRGHKAYVEPANVKGRGLWYRVRVGPFKYRHSAVIYRQDFEAKERMVTFIVDPPKPGARPKGDDE
jgi:cell division septation protein DedD